MCNDSKNLQQIEDLRQRLIQLADEKGFTHTDTVMVSQELDQLLNRYNMMKYGKTMKED